MGMIVPQIFKVYDERQQRLDDLNNTLQENLPACAWSRRSCARRWRSPALRAAGECHARAGL
jgi:hypothetical protein